MLELHTKLVLFALYRAEKEGHTWLGPDELTTRTGLAASTLNDEIDRLSQRKYVVVSSQDRRNPFRFSRVELTIGGRKEAQLRGAADAITPNGRARQVLKALAAARLRALPGTNQSVRLTDQALTGLALSTIELSEALLKLANDLLVHRM